MSSDAAGHMYERIAEALREKILARTLAAGEHLPTRDELAARFDVSETTVRRALALLESEGLIDRGRGAAPIVRPCGPSRSVDDDEQDDEFTRVRQDPNPIRRARLASALIETYRRRMLDLAQVRKDAIEQAHDTGMTYTEVADALGLTKGRIAQIRSQATPRP
ncbi:GntR family transcriptional regulator [Amycolatopsis sp. NPDC003731]